MACYVIQNIIAALVFVVFKYFGPQQKSLYSLQLFVSFELCMSYPSGKNDAISVVIKNYLYKLFHNDSFHNDIKRSKIYLPLPLHLLVLYPTISF